MRRLLGADLEPRARWAVPGQLALLCALAVSWSFGARTAAAQPRQWKTLCQASATFSEDDTHGVYGASLKNVQPQYCRIDYPGPGVLRVTVKQNPKRPNDWVGGVNWHLVRSDGSVDGNPVSLMDALNVESPLPRALVATVSVPDPPVPLKPATETWYIVVIGPGRACLGLSPLRNGRQTHQYASSAQATIEFSAGVPRPGESLTGPGTAAPPPSPPAPRPSPTAVPTPTATAQPTRLPTATLTPPPPPSSPTPRRTSPPPTGPVVSWTATAPTGPRGRPAVLSGRILRCTRNQRGEVSGPDRPVAGALVIVGNMEFETGLSGMDVVKNSGGIAGKAFTDQNGNFQMTVPAGTYANVIVWKQRFVTQIDHPITAPGQYGTMICDDVQAPATHDGLRYDPVLPPDGPFPKTPTPGAPATATAAPGGIVVLGGTVQRCMRGPTGARSGPDQPLVGALVLVGTMEFETGNSGIDVVRGSTGIVGRATSGPGGAWRMTLPAGTYEHLLVWKERFVPSNLANVSAPGVLDLSICDDIQPPATHAALRYESSRTLAERPDLGTVWTVDEIGKWFGTFTRRPGTDTFDCTWSGPNGASARDVIEVESVEGNRIVLSRKGNGGRYAGTLSQDGKRIEGTASWYRAGERWTASIH